MAEFRLGIDKINALADQSLGFVWCLHADSCNATTDYQRPHDNPNIVFNLLRVVVSIDVLREYTYKTAP